MYHMAVGCCYRPISSDTNCVRLYSLSVIHLDTDGSVFLHPVEEFGCVREGFKKRVWRLQ